jgi:ubiquitin-protein ligase
MVITKEEIRTLLNKLQNDKNCKYDFDYFDEKEKNPFVWKTVLEGSQGSIYENGFYMLKITFSESYPEEQPSVVFLNKIFHPHISSSGSACIVPPKKDILTVMDTVEDMFLEYDKDIDHAYGQDPKKYYVENPNKFIEEAKKWVREYAKLEDLDKYYD